ncbi:MAG: sulfatase-like hydrolase/transferase [Opitutales bacterium]|nr:sulfatase-like hydrolase/transferase [Opitutales bacterium]
MKPPNILVFLTDDHGQWASGAYGNRELHTPVMQWLADTGARAEHAFCPNPVCSPARASFWTGQIPSRHGIHDYLGEPNENPVHRGIAGQPTLASFLQERGYRTGMVGKWHAGDYWHPMPGFDTWFTSTRGTNARCGPQAFVDGTERIETFGHQETVYTDRALRFLREWSADAEKPFFLYAGYTNTHTPHDGETAPLVHHYRKCRFADLPGVTYTGAHGHARIAPFDAREDARRAQNAEYYAAVEVIDQQMLRIVAELENLGQLENTLIVYTSDHGHMNGHHGLHTKANATIPPNFLEESLHVPLLLRHPRLIPEGMRLPSPVDHCDLFATLLDAAGADAEAVAARQASPGRSFLPLLRDTRTPWRQLQFAESGPNRMVRSARDKLIVRFPLFANPAGEEYYDLENDPTETTNAASNPAHRHRVAELRRELEAYFGRYSDPAKSGTNPAALGVRHNDFDAWLKKPGDDDHRQ